MPSQKSVVPSRRSRPHRVRRSTGFAGAIAISLGVAMLLPASAGAAQAPVGLGTATSFAVLAGSGITNTGVTTVTGDIGSSPNPSETGLGSMVRTGVDHAGDSVTQQAQIDLTTAYNVAAAATPATAVAVELGGTTLTPGVYSHTTLGLTGTLTLDALGDPNAVFIFQSASTLITASNSAVVILNGGTACNVYWQVGSSATLGTDTAFVGSILALTSITATTGATVQGRLLARNGAVTLDTNTITNTGCAAAGTTTIPGGGGTTTTTPGGGGTTTTTPGGGGATTTTPSGGGSTPTTSAATTGSIPTAGSGTPGAPGTDLTGDTPSTGPGTPTTTHTQRPDLPFTGANLWYALLGGLSLAIGVVLLVVSGAWTRLAKRHHAS